jgi:hypothetical protein
MPGKPWTTEEQATFLAGYTQQYQQAQSDGTLPAFWPRIYREWFQRYSEQGSMFPGSTTLTMEQEDLLRAKINKRQRVSNS